MHQVIPTPATESVRPQCKLSYVRSIEDVAAAVVLGRRILGGAILPTVGGAYPGRALIEHTPILDLYSGVPNSNRDISERLNDAEFRKEVEASLVRLPKLIAQYPHVFREWLLRESAATLDEFASLPAGNASEIGRNYLIDEVAEAGVPSATLVLLGDIVNRGRHSKITIESFIRRNLVNLVAICGVYDSSALAFGSLRTPNTVRAQLLLESSKSPRLLPHNLVTALGRGILATALTHLGLRPAAELPNVLMTMRASGPFTRLASDLFDACEGNGQPTEIVDALYYGPGSTPGKDALVVNNRKLLQRLSDSFNDSGYEDLLARKFPDLYPRPDLRPKSYRLTIDEVQSFAKVRSVKPVEVARHLSNGRLEASESSIKQALRRILSEFDNPKDWGGEWNDFYSSNLTVDGNRRIPAAFALKGNGAKGRNLKLSHYGANADQIVRLFLSPAELFVVQGIAPFDQTLISAVDAHARARNLEGYPVRYLLIDGTDTARLLVAYGELDGIMETMHQMPKGTLCK